MAGITYEQSLVMGRLVPRIVDYQGHWLWSGATNGVGYGVVRYLGKKWYVHRLVVETLRGPIPAGRVVDHLCGVTLCFHPKHLEVVTQRTNTLRAVRDVRTSCRHGHPWTPANTYIVPTTGARQCVPCRNARQRARRAAMRGI